MKNIEVQLSIYQTDPIWHVTRDRAATSDTYSSQLEKVKHTMYRKNLASTAPISNKGQNQGSNFSLLNTIGPLQNQDFRDASQLPSLMGILVEALAIADGLDGLDEWETKN
jgi:hypothetical protein